MLETEDIFALRVSLKYLLLTWPRQRHRSSPIQKSKPPY